MVKYTHDFEELIADMEFLPDALRGQRYYKSTPSDMKRLFVNIWKKRGTKKGEWIEPFAS